MTRNRLSNKLTKTILEYEYNRLGSMQKVADHLNVSVDSVYKYMKLHGVVYKQHYQGIYTCNEEFFKNDAEQSFYWAGFIAADGSLQKRKYSKILKVALSQNDHQHVELFKSSISSNHPIKVYRVKPSKLVKSESMCSEIQIANNNIYNDLSRFNIIPNKTKTYTFPEWLTNHELVNHFMRGYFDGDGCISKCGLGKNRTVIQKSFSILGTKQFINQYMNILVLKQIVNEVKISPHYSVYQLSYSGNNNIRKIHDFLYKNATIWLDRKRTKFQDVVTE